MIKTAGPLAARVEVTTCNGYRSGSGFVVGPNLVATVAHVVDGSQTIAVRGIEVASASVVGIDNDRQVALLKTTTPMSNGAALTFAPDEPAEGDEVISISYPKGRPQTPTSGTVNGLDRSVDVDGRRLAGLIQFNADVSPGSSGGPLLDLKGQVVGVTEAQYDDAAGLGYAVSTTTARGLVAAWKSAPASIETPSCKSRRKTVVAVRSEHPDAPGLAYFVRRNFDGLNVGDDQMPGDDSAGTGYETAFAIYSGQLKDQLGPFERYRSGRIGAKNSKVVISNVTKLDEIEDSLDISFNRVSDDGSCKHFRYRYTARLASGTWTLDSRVRLDPDKTAC